MTTAFPSDKWLKFIQHRAARNAVTPSTLRNVVGAGSVAAITEKLSGLNLRDEFLNIDSDEALERWLNEKTESLRAALIPLPNEPETSWGAARKCLNIFLLECSLNRFLCAAYDLTKIEPWLEVPLDSEVSAALHKETAALESWNRTLPTWTTVKRLTPEESKQFQNFANHVAGLKDETICRVHLDLEYWGHAKDHA